MASRSSSDVETACPSCGFGPLAADAERCPKCYVAFKRVTGPQRHNDRESAPIGSDDGEGTQVGFDVLTSDAEAHPGTMAAALAALGLLAGAVGMGLVAMPGDPSGYLILGTVDGLLALALLVAPSYARPLVIVSSPIQVATWLWFGRPMFPAPALLAVSGMPLLILAGVTGATGPRRRSAVLATVLAAVTFAATVQTWGRRGAPLEVEAGETGLHLRLPPGFKPLHQLDDLAAYVPGPGLDRRIPSFAFADPVRQVGGYWGVTQPGQVTPSRLAQAVAAQLDDGRNVGQFVRDELQAFVTLPQSAWEIPLGGGRVASATALRLPDDRTALLVVSGPRKELASARQELARAASFGKPADPH